MSDLIAELKARLTVQDVIAQKYPLQRRGRMLVATDRDVKPGEQKQKSLEIDPTKQVWVWHAQTPDVRQKRLGGDVLSWIAFNRFGRVKVEGEQFIEVLKDACKLAGMDYEGETEKRRGGDGEKQKERAAARALVNEKREIMGAYLEVAEKARTPEFLVRARQIGAKPDGSAAGKTFLTAECIEEWRIGFSPTLAQCRAAGITEKQLRLCRLLIDPLREGPDESPYMHFHDSLVIPWFESGEVVFLSNRRLTDYDRAGQALEKKKKSMSMFGVENGGVARPAAFNLDTIRSLFNAEKQKRENVKELLIVEGPLDAIACEQQGHAAIALGNTSPTQELVEHLKGYPQVIRYLALDGTEDVDALKRAEVAAMLGIYTRVCTLPVDKDPDELQGEALAGLKAAAVDVFECWGELVNAE